MAREYRQNTPYEDINNGEGDEGTEAQSSHGNTRLPFGLCKKYGIPLPDYATPRMAWEALKRGTGLTPDQIYDHLASGKELPQKLPEQAREITNLSDNEVVNNNQRNSTSHMSEKARQAFDDFQTRTSGKQLKHEEALAVAADGTVVQQIPVAQQGYLDGVVYGAHATPYRILGRDWTMVIILLISCMCTFALSTAYKRK